MKILVGYDGSDASRKALDLAVTHAKAFNGQIVIVASMDKGSAAEQDDIKNKEAELASVKKELEQQGPACETHLLIRGMSPGEDLVKYAQEKGIDEIILSIQRTSKVGKLVFGSTAQYVILNATCPVVTLK
jgi:nucleotide-binding universal stress UspA family protein